MSSDPGAAFGAHPFWAFSLRVYGAPGVARAALALQDRLGLDVNLLLFCLWAGASGHRLSSAAISAIAGAADEWNRAVVSPIRAARRRMKAGSPHLDPDATEAVRQDVLAAEIGCERAEQMLIAKVAEPFLARSGDAPAPLATAHNLAAYVTRSGIGPTEEDIGDLETLIHAALSAPHADRAGHDLRSSFKGTPDVAPSAG